MEVVGPAQEAGPAISGERVQRHGEVFDEGTVSNAKFLVHREPGLLREEKPLDAVKELRIRADLDRSDDCQCTDEVHERSVNSLQPGAAKGAPHQVCPDAIELA